MNQYNPGIDFKEIMSGSFALGLEDPEDGARQGRRDGSIFAIHNHIAIPDVGAFVDDPEHCATLDATVDFAPLGRGIAAETGVFQLFVPEDEHTRLMIYRFGFRHGGESYYFHGTKFMHTGTSAATLWRESTHLYSTLHLGDDADAPIIGAGILSLGIGRVLAMASSMRVRGARSPVEYARTLAEFDRFLGREFWRLHGWARLGQSAHR